LCQKPVHSTSYCATRGCKTTREITMANRPQPFRQHQITRALRAAVAAGMPNPSVLVRCPNGTVITIDSKSDAVAILKPGKVRPSSRRPTR
jgi:hypothetical protein